jgi:hypothetical protein
MSMQLRTFSGSPPPGLAYLGLPAKESGERHLVSSGFNAKRSCPPDLGLLRPQRVQATSPQGDA